MGPLAMKSNALPQFSGDFVVVALRERIARSSQCLVGCCIFGRDSKRLLGLFQLLLRIFWIDQGRAAEHDDRRANAELLESEFRFEILELKPHGAQFG